MSKNLEERIANIEARNARVEADKAWETSWLRAVVILIVTYITVVIFFRATHVSQPLVSAIEPCMGLLLSTITVTWLKRRWIERRLKD